MQRKHTKGLFIDSAYRRAGLLKTLLQGFRREREVEDAASEAYGRSEHKFPAPGGSGQPSRDDNVHMKKAASL